MFDDLAAELKELAAIDWDGLCDAELDDAVVELARLTSQVQAVEAHALRRWKPRMSWRADGSRSPSSWLAKRTRAPKKECGSKIWLAHALVKMPLLAEAFLAGDVTVAHLRRAAEAHNHRTVEAFTRDEHLFLTWAIELDFFRFDQRIREWLLRNDPDGCSQRDADRRDRRDAYLSESFEGMFLGKLTMDPVSGQIVYDELARLEKQLFDEDWREARDRLNRDPVSSELRRTPGQRRHDAFVLMAQRSARPVAGSAPKPLFSVVIGIDAYRWLCQLGCGQIVSPAALIPWIDDAQLEALLFDGPQRPITVSRKRRFTGALRRVLEVRDRFCTHPSGCDVPAEQCEGDHIVPYSVGGMTAHWNGRMRCDPHNPFLERRRSPLP